MDQEERYKRENILLLVLERTKREYLTMNQFSEQKECEFTRSEIQKRQG